MVVEGARPSSIRRSTCLGLGRVGRSICFLLLVRRFGLFRFVAFLFFLFFLFRFFLRLVQRFILGVCYGLLVEIHLLLGFADFDGGYLVSIV